jgi:hypothetical protein
MKNPLVAKAVILKRQVLVLGTKLFEELKYLLDINSRTIKMLSLFHLLLSLNTINIQRL